MVSLLALDEDDLKELGLLKMGPRKLVVNHIMTMQGMPHLQGTTVYINVSK